MDQIAYVLAHVSYFLCCTGKRNAAFTLGAKVQYSLGTNVYGYKVSLGMFFFFGGGGRVDFCPHSSIPVT